jgi:methyl-accepting chemotaxis protein
MNNYTNIYDIDGNIIRKAGDNHRFTIEEVEKLVDDLTAKVQQNPDNQVYRVYLNNAHKWLYNMYNNMSVEELTKRISTIQDAIQAAKDNATELEQKNLEELNKTMDEFAEQYNADQPDSAPVLERDPDGSESRPETVMDEYVEPIEEIK